MRTGHLRYALIIALFAGPLRAEESRWPIDRAKPPFPAPYSYQPDSLRDAPAEYLRDAAVCFLYSGTTQTVESDGTIATTTMEVIRLNSRRGIEQQAQYRSITYNPAYETVALHAAKVHKANGADFDVEARHINVRDVNTDHQVYDSNKQVIISFPRLDVGDVLEVFWTVRGRHPEFQDQFFYRYSFGNEKYPVLRDEWTVRMPKDRPLRYESINGAVPVAISEADGLKIYSWKTTNRAAPPPGDRQPPADEQKLQIACSTFLTWQSVFEWEKKLLADRCNCKIDGKNVVAEVTRALKTDEEKARALTHWVRTHVRYLSRGEKHDYTPHPPERVLTDRCGDCKDAANLLAVLMREAGLKAGVATLGPRGDGQVLESLPCPWGTHALTVVTIDGQDHWIDTTAVRIGWDVLPRDDRDRACYITNPSGIRFSRTPGTTPADAKTEATTTINVATNGDATVERVTRYFGVTAWLKREEYADTPQADARLAIANDLQEAFPRAKITKLAFESMEEFESPLVVRTEFTVPELFSGEGASFDAKIGDFAYWTALLAASANPERTVALDVGDPASHVSRFIINLPPVYRFAATPEGQAASSRWGKLDIRVEQPENQPRRLEIESKAALTESRANPSEFPLWRDFQDLVQATFRVTVAIKPTRDPADIAQLEEVCAKTPDDVRSLTALAGLYLDQKENEKAKQALEKACTAAPTERKIWEMRLAATDDLGEQERIYRLMLPRFPDDAKLTIELGQNLLDQERPADAQEVLTPLLKHADPAIQASALIDLAHAALAQDDPKKALKHLKAAEKAHAASLDADAWFLRGQVHEALGEPKAAIKSYRQALDEEEAPDALEALTRLSIAVDAKREAAAYLRRLAVAATADPEGLARAAELAVQLGRYEDALDLAHQSRLGYGSMHQAARRPLGLALYHQGKFSDAVEQLEKSDANADSLAALMRTLAALGRLADAEALLARLEIVEPNAESRQAAAWIRALVARRAALTPSVRAASATGEAVSMSIQKTVCAEGLHKLGLWPEQVDRLLDDAVAEPDPCGVAFGLRAMIRIGRGQFTTALRDAESAINLSPNEPSGYHARGRIRLERAQSGAIADLEKAAQLTGTKDAAVLHDLAAAYLAAGRKAEALPLQREAAKLNPEDRSIREQLREMESTK